MGLAHSPDCQRSLWTTFPWNVLRADIVLNGGLRGRPAHSRCPQGPVSPPTLSFPDTDRPAPCSQASKSFWQTRPPEGGLWIQPWQWGKVNWGPAWPWLCSLRWRMPTRLVLPAPCISSSFLTARRSPLGSAGPIGTGQAGGCVLGCQRWGKEVTIPAETLSPPVSLPVPFFVV